MPALEEHSFPPLQYTDKTIDSYQLEVFITALKDITY